MYINMCKDSRVVKGAGLKTQCVSFVGSNPTSCNKLYIYTRVPERSNGSDLRSDGFTFAGSNPASCIAYIYTRLAQSVER